MNIFGIIGLSAFIALLVFLMGFVILLVKYGDSYDVPTKSLVSIIIVAVMASVGSVFLWIGADTSNERIYVEKFQAQKITIEQSLESEALSGAERVQLVNKAVDLNGELAERKAKFDIWYYVYYDNAIYDDVEPIKFDTEVEE